MYSGIFARMGYRPYAMPQMVSGQQPGGSMQAPVGWSVASPSAQMGMGQISPGPQPGQVGTGIQPGAIQAQMQSGDMNWMSRPQRVWHPVQADQGSSPVFAGNMPQMFNHFGFPSQSMAQMGGAQPGSGGMGVSMSGGNMMGGQMQPPQGWATASPSGGAQMGTVQPGVGVSQSGGNVMNGSMQAPAGWGTASPSGGAQMARVGQYGAPMQSPAMSRQASRDYASNWDNMG